MFRYIVADRKFQWIWLFRDLMFLPESLETHHIGFHKRFYFPFTEIPEQQHKSSDENNEEEKTFQRLGVYPSSP